MPTAPRSSRPAPALRAAAALAGLAATAALTGCSLLEYRENICRSGEYPVLAVNNSGSGCVTDGEAPPPGYARYPEGKVPRQVDDEWDVYWRTHTLDEHGTVVPAPDDH
ncbi:SCO0607 family lipoprotein [Streptomyces sp. enrichment culture]|uniref:SCO0607 family lipoprotein n=1 Tax=Streptomyces sp. enrichment culture TaxID=1795815 RepID=UPI003F5649EB